MIRLIASLLLLACVPAFAGTTHNVTLNPDFTFSPNVLNISQGDSVTFTNAGGFHNVRADSGPTVFRCANGCDGSGGNGAPSGAAWSVTVTFPSAGTVPFYCEVHGSPGAGMSGQINIAVPVELQSFEVE